MCVHVPRSEAVTSSCVLCEVKQAICSQGPARLVIMQAGPPTSKCLTLLQSIFFVLYVVLAGRTTNTGSPGPGTPFSALTHPLCTQEGLDNQLMS